MNLSLVFFASVLSWSAAAKMWPGDTTKDRAPAAEFMELKDLVPAVPTGAEVLIATSTHYRAVYGGAAVQVSFEFRGQRRVLLDTDGVFNVINQICQDGSIQSLPDAVGCRAK